MTDATLATRLADSLADDPVERRANGHVAVFGVRRVADPVATERADRRELRIGTGGDDAARTYEFLSVPAVERALADAFAPLADERRVAGLTINPVSPTIDGLVSVRVADEVSAGSSAGTVRLRPGTLFPFIIDVRQPTLAELLYVLAHLQRRTDYPAARRSDRADVRLSGPMANHVVAVASHWGHSSTTALSLVQAVVTALASRRTHGSFVIGDDARYTFDDDALAGVVAAADPLAVADATAALEHAVESVVPFGAMFGLNELVAGDALETVLRRVREDPGAVVDALSE